MGHYKYDRLSAQDTSFLIFEKDNVNMHVSSAAIYKAGSLKTKAGGIDFARIKQAIGDTLHRIPRYRQKLMWIQKNRTAVWVDDAQFKLDYHVRHTSLPKPGSQEQLKELASRIIERRLDRTKPLWEIWVVEGLAGNQFALINKIHHSMIDGTSGVELSQLLMSPDPKHRPEEPPVYYPRPMPSQAELWHDEYERYMTLPLKAIQNFQEFANDSQDFVGEITTRAKALADTFSHLGGASETPLNGVMSSHRIIDWISMSMADVKAVHRSLGCTVNDLVLATVTQAVRNFFLNRQVRPEEIDFKVAAPVSVRREDQKGQMGNRVSSWIIALPIGEPDPIRQLETINAITKELKETNQAVAVEMMMALAEWTPSLLSLGARAGGQSANTIVTNVPGPQFPLYLIGAEMVDIFPGVPLLENMGIGIALMSYNGRLCWGFNGDYGKISDIANFVRHISDAFAQLADIAGVTLGADHSAIFAATDKKKPKKAASAKKSSRRKASAASPRTRKASAAAPRTRKASASQTTKASASEASPSDTKASSAEASPEEKPEERTQSSTSIH